MLSSPNGTPMATLRIVIVWWYSADSGSVVLKSVNGVDVDLAVVGSELVVLEVIEDADHVTLCADPNPLVFELIDDSDVAVPVAWASDKPTSVALWVLDERVLGVPRSVAVVARSAESC